MATYLRAFLSYIPFIGQYFTDKSTPPTPEVLPPAKIAIIGGGVGGCSAAYFLNREGGSNLDIHVFNDGDIGGRCAVIEFEGNTYEEGASVIHTSNKYLVDFRKEFGLKEYSSKKEPTTPTAIYNGQGFVLHLGWSGFINSLKILWRYGLSVVKMSRSVSKQLKRFVNIYQLQDEGKCYRTVPELLNAMAGNEDFYKQTQVNGDNYFTAGLNWNKRLVDELVCAAMKTNYGQNNNQIDAFTAFVSLAGVEDGSLWSVIGGNYQLSKRALEASGATVHGNKVTSVSRVDNGDCTSYSLEYIAEGDGTTVTVTGFDLVIIAHPLNLSTVQFNGFSSNIYTPAAKTPYHHTIATFVKGEINGQTFGLTGNDYPHSFPLSILGIDLVNPPVVFSSIAAKVPTTASEEEAKKTYLKPLQDQSTRVWKVFSNHILSDEDKSKLFRKIDAISVKDWLAYPEYDPPEEFPPFVLDDKGLLYINCIEKAASAMEMSAIGAKNVALLAKQYILANKKNN